MAGTVLVTGGSGYIAGFLIQKLLADGWTVHATVRSLAREAEVRGSMGVEDRDRLRFFAADLTDDAGWAAAVTGCTHVAHVASPFPSGRVTDDMLIGPARDGALRALRFARDAGVTRFVQTSSVAAVAYGHPGQERFTEADWTDVDAPGIQPYIKSKTIAERAAREWVAKEGGGIEFVSINPSAVLGPVQSADFSTSIQIVQRLIDGSFPGIPDIGFGVVDVRDLADLHVLALTTPGLAGERFIASGRFVWLKEAAEILRRDLGQDARKVPRRHLPNWIIHGIALFDGSVKQIAGELGHARAFDAGHAADRLGWRTRPVEESIVDTARSLIAHSVVRV